MNPIRALSASTRETGPFHAAHRIHAIEIKPLTSHRAPNPPLARLIRASPFGLLRSSRPCLAQSLLMRFRLRPLLWLLACLCLMASLRSYPLALMTGAIVAAWRRGSVNRGCRKRTIHPRST